MKLINSDSDSQSNKHIVVLFIILRWFAGGIIGCLTSFFLLKFLPSLRTLPPLLGPILLGQYLLFYYLLPSNYPLDFTFATIDTTSMVLYSVLWGVIGGMFASGKRIQRRFGIIFLILYITIGCLLYLSLWFQLAMS